MKIEAVVKIGGGAALYQIYREGPSCYRAELQPLHAPAEGGLPKDILLMRSVRHWVGSVDHPKLVEELGEAIDSILQNAPIFQREEPSRSQGKSPAPEM